MHGQVLTPKRVLESKIAEREKQKKAALRKKQREDRLALIQKTPAAAKETEAGEERLILTPEKAIELLEHNSLNRPLNDGHVRRIAQQIKDGKWRYNGDTIKVSDTGDVLDGQHRLWAIIEAKKLVETLIVYGIAREAFATIDALRKPRSGADVLALNGANRYRTVTSAALQWLLRWQRGVLPQFKAPQNRIENSDIEDAWGSHAGIINAVESAMKFRRICNPGILGFAYYVLSNRNPELAERMMKTLEFPATVPLIDPFMKLREYFMADHFKRKEPLYTIALIFKAANAAAEGRNILVLRWTNQGEKAEAFPDLKV